MDDRDRFSERTEDDQFDEYTDAETEIDEIETEPFALTPGWTSDDQETSAELTADDADTTAEIENTDDDHTNVNSVYGWIALALSIVSFFWMPIVLGAAGIIVGFVARNYGAKTLGITAIIAGAASIIISLFILPLV